MILPANLLTGAKHPQTKFNYYQEQHKKPKKTMQKTN